MQNAFARTGDVHEQVELAALIEEAIALGCPNADHHGVTLTRIVAPDSRVAIGRHRVLQIAVNLLANARDSILGQRARLGPEAGPGLITVRATADAGWLELADDDDDDDDDDGDGISPEVLPRIFNAGFTTRTTGHGDGLHSSSLARAPRRRLAVHERRHRPRRTVRAADPGRSDRESCRIAHPASCSSTTTRRSSATSGRSSIAASARRGRPRSTSWNASSPVSRPPRSRRSSRRTSSASCTRARTRCAPSPTPATPSGRSPARSSTSACRQDRRHRGRGPDVADRTRARDRAVQRVQRLLVGGHRAPARPRRSPARAAQAVRCDGGPPARGRPEREVAARPPAPGLHRRARADADPGRELVVRVACERKL